MGERFCANGGGCRFGTGDIGMMGSSRLRERRWVTVSVAVVLVLVIGSSVSVVGAAPQENSSADVTQNETDAAAKNNIEGSSVMNTPEYTTFEGNKTVLIALLNDTKRYTDIKETDLSYTEKSNRFRETSKYQSSIDQLEEYGSLYESPTRTQGQNTSTPDHYLFFLNAVMLETSEENEERIANLSFVEDVWRGDRMIPLNVEESPSKYNAFGSNLSQVESNQLTPKQLWEQVTEDNWGYEGTGMKSFHEDFFKEYRGEGVDVAVIDTGFDKDHPLHNPVLDGEPHRDYHVNVVSARYPFVGSDSYDDTNGHGTQDLGVVWQAVPNANYHVIKARTNVFTYHFDDFVGHIEYAKQVGSDVITTSVYRPSCDEPQDGSSPISEAATEAADEDTVVVALAGNSADNCNYPTIPSTGEDVISVSSTSESIDHPGTQGTISYSNSPQQTHNGKPDVAAPGASIDSLDLGGTTGARYGSSFAAPHVAGIAALLNEPLVGYGSDANNIRDSIYSSAVDVDNTDLDGNGRASVVGAFGELKPSTTPDPRVQIVDNTVSGSTSEFKVELDEQNSATPLGTERSGVHLQLSGAMVQSISLGSFDECLVGDGVSVSGCEQRTSVPSGVVELYAKDGKYTATSGTIETELTNPGDAEVSYRGWIRHRLDTTYNPYSNLYEGYIARTPSEGNEISPDSPSPQSQNNPPFSRAAHDNNFDITEYETHSPVYIGPTDSSISVSPDTWDIGAVSEEDTVSTSVTLTNEGEIQSDISASSGSGISTTGVPESIDVGESDSFTATVDASEYNGGQIRIDYTGGTLRIPIDITVIQSGDITDTETEELSDEAFCESTGDLWDLSVAPGDCSSSTRDWSDTLDLGFEERTGLTEAELTVEYRTFDQSVSPDPITVEVNGEEIGQIEAPSDFDERSDWRTKTFTLDTSLLSSDNTIKMSTDPYTKWDIGSIYDNNYNSDGDTKITYTYREEADINLDAKPSSVTAEQGDTFTIQATAENDGGRTLDDGLFQVSDYDSSKLNLRDQDSVNLGEIEPGQVTTRSWTFEYQSEEPTTVEFYASGVADETATDDRESVSIMPPNDPPVINSFSSPSEAHPNSEVSYTATVSDPDGDEVDVTLEVYLPSENRWETYGTRTVSGSGTAEFNPSPFGADDIGKEGEYRFEYQDGFENAGTWGPFTGPVIANPNTESPSFSDWSYPTEVEPTEDADVSVDITDPNGVESASIEYIYPNGTQKQRQMSQSGTTWSATIPAPEGGPVIRPMEDSQTDVISYSISATDGSQFPKSSESITRYIQVQEDTNPPNYQLVSLNRSEIAVSDDETSVDIQVEVKNTGGPGTQDLQLDIIDDQTGNVVHSVTRQDVSLQDTLETNDIERNVINPDPQSTITFGDVSIADLETGDYTYTIFSKNDSISGSLIINENYGSQPTASFKYSPSGPGTSEEITFDASGSTDTDGSIKSYTWSFGDGATATGETVTHSYTEPGNFEVSLTVTDDDGETDTTAKDVPVGEDNIPPTASFSYSPASPDTSDTVTFDASTSSDSDGSIQSYEWEFGDGTTATGVSPTHSYSGSGEYSVTLTVTDNDGLTNKVTRTVSVESAASNSPPTASFTYIPKGPSVSDAVTFDASTSSDSDGSIQSYEWEFGDGTTATGVSPTHSYSGSGEYSVTLTVIDNDGDTDTKRRTIPVESDNDNGGDGGEDSEGTIDDIQTSLSDTDGDGTSDRLVIEVTVSDVSTGHTRIEVGESEFEVDVSPTDTEDNGQEDFVSSEDPDGDGTPEVVEFVGVASGGGEVDGTYTVVADLLTRSGGETGTVEVDLIGGTSESVTYVDLSSDNPFGDMNGDPLRDIQVVQKLVSWNEDGQIDGESYGEIQIVQHLVEWNEAS